MKPQPRIVICDGLLSDGRRACHFLLLHGMQGCSWRSRRRCWRAGRALRRWASCSSSRSARPPWPSAPSPSASAATSSASPSYRYRFAARLPLWIINLALKFKIAICITFGNGKKEICTKKISC